MPIATLVALKSSFEQSALVAAPRLAGAIIGAALASLFLLMVDNKHVWRWRSSFSVRWERRFGA
jgi:uncharacterized membrane protein YgaE (UPF0421/DUF939 family)